MKINANRLFERNEFIQIVVNLLNRFPNTCDSKSLNANQKSKKSIIIKNAELVRSKSLASVIANEQCDASKSNVIKESHLIKTSSMETLKALEPLQDESKREIKSKSSHKTMIKSTIEKNQILDKMESLEMELKELRIKYDDLNKKYADLSSLYNECMSEISPKNNLNQRRVFVLKSLNIQLQRHLNQLKESIQSRDSFLFESGEDLQKIHDILKSLITVLTNEKGSKSSNPAIAESLSACLKYIQALQKQLHLKSRDRLRESDQDKTPDFMFISDFVVQKGDLTYPTLADICSGEYQHLNLKHISRLESQLHSLYQSNSILSRFIFNIFG